MKRLQIDILGCRTIDDYHIYFSGDDSSRNKIGVAIILSKETNVTVKGFILISNSVALIRIKVKPFDLNITQAFAPTSESHETDIEDFYEQLKTALKHTKKEEINIILCDTNANVGEEMVEHVVKTTSSCEHFRQTTCTRTVHMDISR